MYIYFSSNGATGCGAMARTYGVLSAGVSDSSRPWPLSANQNVRDVIFYDSTEQD